MTRRIGPKSAKNRKRSAGPGKSRSDRPGLPRRLLRWLLLSLVGLTLAGVLYGIYLDQVVRVRFEGKRWSLPARVYARPMELYTGLRLKPATLRAELERLGYARVRHPDRPGAYSSYKGRFLIRSREFLFWDGVEPSRYLEVRFGQGRVLSLNQAATGAAVPLARLDAALIDSIYPAHREDRVLVKREQLPQRLVQTLLAVEDRQFYAHHGLDPWAILRALWSNLRAGRVVQGGSTLTQQLVKNFYLSNERSLRRKLNEAAMSLLLDVRYSKDAILEAYVNEIYLGQEGNRAIHGFGLASRFYFNRPLNELDLPRIALLVGMIKGPSYYNPRRHPQRARKRRDLVLDVLVDQGVIGTQQAKQAKAQGLNVTKKGARPAGRYPAFMQLVRRQLQRDYRAEDLSSEGLSIFTTLDPLIQRSSEQAVAKRLPQLEKSARSSQLEAAVVVAGVDNGEVLALVGGRRSGYSGFNRALEAVRPVGSLVKPLVYLEALDRPKRYQPVTLLRDEAVRLKGAGGRPWRPKNFDGKTHGQVPLFQALARSYNLATVNLGMDLGLDKVMRRLRKLGLERDVQALPSLLLGSLSLSPLELAQLYQPLAAGGFRTPLRAVLDVLNANGRPLNRYPLEVRQVANSKSVYLLDWSMQQVVQQGTGRKLGKILPTGLRVAGKTGTTNDFRDSWFAGFSGDKVAVVWVGRDDNRPAGLTGAGGALPIWGDIIGGTGSLSRDDSVPDGVQLHWVEPVSGRLVDAQCAGALRVPFIRGSEPRQRADCMAGDEDTSGFFQRFFQ